jgi:hypothetical protein
LLDYPEIIKKPMDLKTCRKNLTKGKYKKYDEFFKDIQLIWDNCKTYNIQGSDIYKQAENMEKKTKKLVNKIKDELGLNKGGNSKSSGATKKKTESKKAETTAAAEGPDDDEDEAEEVPFEKKVSFTEKVRRLTNDGLTKLVKKCKELCPDALEDVDAEKLHIKVDFIDKESFDKLDQLVEENLHTGATKR